MSAAKIKKGDTVIVLSGKDKGKEKQKQKQKSQSTKCILKFFRHKKKKKPI